MRECLLILLVFIASVAYGQKTDLEAGSFNVKEWYAEKAKTGWQVNYGSSASLLYNRMAVHDPDAELSAQFGKSNFIA